MSAAAGALSLCESLDVNWPSDTDILWLKIENESVVRKEGGTDGVDVSVLVSKTQQLHELKNKLLVEARKNNVCQSIRSRLVKINWPEKVTANIRKMWVNPFDTKTSIVDVMYEMRDLWRDDCLELHGFPLNSESGREALSIFGQLFFKVGLVKPELPGSYLLFFRFQKWTISASRRLQSICNAMTDGDPQDTSILNNNNLCSSKFSKYLLIMNWLHVRDEVLDLIHNIDSADSERSPIIDMSSDNNNNRLVCRSCKSTGRCLINCKKLGQELDDLKSYLDQIVLCDPKDNQSTFELEFSETQLTQLLEIVDKSSKIFSIEEIAQFCLLQLVHCYWKISKIFRSTLMLSEEEISDGSCLILDPDQNILTSLEKYSWANGPLEVKVLDFAKQMWMNLENHADFQVEVLQRICNALEDTWRGESLELRGFPMLTEFNASIIFLLGHMFDQVRFSNSTHGRNSVLFLNFKSYYRCVRDHLEKAISDCSLVHREAVMSLVPLKFLYGGEFYEKLRLSNNRTLLKNGQYMIKLLHLKIEDTHCI